MAIGPSSEADHVRDKARKDLLNLLEGVSKATRLNLCGARVTKLRPGSREEKSRD